MAKISDTYKVIMSGFKKCGVYPLNPGEITDRQITPSSAVFCSENVFNEYDVSSQNQSNDEQEDLYILIVMPSLQSVS